MLILWYFPQSSLGQLTEKVNPIVVGLEATFGGGWWIAHNGQPGQEDKSLLNMQIAWGVRLGYKVNPKWEFGITTAIDRIHGYYLRTADNRVGARGRVPIGTSEDRAYTIRRIGLYAIAWPVQTDRFKLGASVASGIFSETSIHPEKDLFANRWWWRIRLPMTWRLTERFWIEAGPSFYLHTLSQNNIQSDPFRHTIDKLGAFFALTFN